MGKRHEIPAIVMAMNLNGLGVSRVLGRHGVPVYAINTNDRDVELKTRHVRDLWVRGRGDDGLIAVLRERAGTFPDKPVLFPITDTCVRVVANHRDELLQHYRIGMPDATLVLKLLDKDGIREAAEETNFPVPRSWAIESMEDLRAAADEIPYPCILKPSGKDRRTRAPATKRRTCSTTRPR